MDESTLPEFTIDDARVYNVSELSTIELQNLQLLNLSWNPHTENDNHRIISFYDAFGGLSHVYDVQFWYTIVCVREIVGNTLPEHIITIIKFAHELFGDTVKNDRLRFELQPKVYVYSGQNIDLTHVEGLTLENNMCSTNILGQSLPLFFNEWKFTMFNERKAAKMVSTESQTENPQAIGSTNGTISNSNMSTTSTSMNMDTQLPKTTPSQFQFSGFSNNQQTQQNPISFGSSNTNYETGNGGGFLTKDKPPQTQQPISFGGFGNNTISFGNTSKKANTTTTTTEPSKNFFGMPLTNSSTTTSSNNKSMFRF